MLAIGGDKFLGQKKQTIFVVRGKQNLVRRLRKVTTTYSKPRKTNQMSMCYKQATPTQRMNFVLPLRLTSALGKRHGMSSKTGMPNLLQNLSFLYRSIYYKFYYNVYN